MAADWRPLAVKLEPHRAKVVPRLQAALPTALARLDILIGQHAASAADTKKFLLKLGNRFGVKKTAGALCARCKWSRYGDRAEQKAAWPTHRIVCPIFATAELL